MINRFGVFEAVKRVLPASSRRVLNRSIARCFHSNYVSSTDGNAFSAYGHVGAADHFARLYFGADTSSRRTFVWHGADWERAALKDAQRFGLAVLAASQARDKLARFILRQPRFVGMSVDLEQSEQKFLSSLPESARSDIRRCRREGFEMHIDRDPSWSYEFYHRYHQSAIFARHGVEGFVTPAPEMEEMVRCDGYEFLCVTQAGTRVAAVLAKPQEEGYLMTRIGWLDGNPALLQRGVLGALYWYTICRARSLGLTRVRMGGTPPYLENGTFQYKMKWNAYPDRTDTNFGEHGLLISPTHPGIKRLLENFSLITLGDDDRFAIFSDRKPDEVRVSPRVLKHIHAWFVPSAGESPPSADLASAFVDILPTYLDPLAARQSTK